MDFLKLLDSVARLREEVQWLSRYYTLRRLLIRLLSPH